MERTSDADGRRVRKTTTRGGGGGDGSRASRASPRGREFFPQSRVREKTRRGAPARTFSSVAASFSSAESDVWTETTVIVARETGRMRPRVRSGAVIVKRFRFQNQRLRRARTENCAGRPGRPAGGNQRDAGARHRRALPAATSSRRLRRALLSGAPTDMFRSGARSVARAIAARCAVAPGAASATASDALAAASRARARRSRARAAARRGARRSWARRSIAAPRARPRPRADTATATAPPTRTPRPSSRSTRRTQSETVVQVRRDAAASWGATQIPRSSGADLPRPPPHSHPFPLRPRTSSSPTRSGSRWRWLTATTSSSRACEGSLACSTCHVIIDDQATYDALPEPDDDENGMLDLAFGLTETSRLGVGHRREGARRDEPLAPEGDEELRRGRVQPAALTRGGGRRRRAGSRFRQATEVVLLPNTHATVAAKNTRCQKNPSALPAPATCVRCSSFPVTPRASRRKRASANHDSPSGGPKTFVRSQDRGSDGFSRDDGS